MQTRVSEVFAWLDDWSDGDIHALAERLRHAPSSHVTEMIGQWPVFSYELPHIKPGRLRPIVSRRRGDQDVIPAALRLLLYTDDVIVDSQVLHPHRAQGDWPSRSKNRWYLAFDITEYLHTLANIRPLIEDGSILFTDQRDQFSGMARENLHQYFSATELIPENSWDFDGFPAVRGLSGSLTVTPHLAPDLFTILDGRATAVALSHNEALIFEATLSRSVPDSRLAGISKLATLNVPDYRMNAKQLVSLRALSQPLRGFRSALRSALAEVAGIPDSPQAVEGAQAVVADVLETELEQVDDEARRSPLLSSLRTAGRKFGLTGIGAATGAATLGTMGLPLAGALAGAATGTAVNAAEAVREFFEERRAQREQEVVKKIVMSFIAD